MSKTKRHHLVPRLYLKYFSIDGKQTYTYFNNLGLCKLVGIKDVSVKENFYTVTHQNITEDFIESTLSSKLEPLWRECIDGIIKYAHQEHNQINLRNICKCLICQYYRGRDFREEATIISEFRINLFRELFKIGAISNAKQKTDNHSLEHALNTFLNEPLIEKKTEQILNLGKWSIMISDRHHFITSDRPVLSFTINMHNNQIYYTKTDIGSPSSYILIAITPNILLQIKQGTETRSEYNGQLNLSIMTVDEEYVKSVNYLQQLNSDEHLYGKYKFDPKISDYTIDDES